MKKNKLLKILIITIILISAEISVIAETTGIVNVETVRVREKATTDSDIVELVSIGDKITITGEEGNWYKVKIGKVTGYIRKDLLTVDGNTIITSNENNKDKNQEQPEENNKDKNQEQPEENNNSNDVPNKTEEPNQNTNTILEENDKEINTIKIAGGVSAGKKIQLTEETKIKILPSANSNNIAKLEANTEVTVLEVINSWCRIETGEYAGWVRIDQ